MLPKALSLSGIIARCLLLCMATGFITSCLSDDEPANIGCSAEQVTLLTPAAYRRRRLRRPC